MIDAPGGAPLAFRRVRRRAPRIAAALAVLVLVASTPLVAGAQDEPDGTPPEDAPTEAAPAPPEDVAPTATAVTMPLEDFGQPGVVVLQGIAAVRTITIPASPDLVPQTLIGTATLSPDAGSAIVEVRDDGERVALLTLTGTDPTPFAIALPPPDADADASILEVRTYLPFDDSYCRGRYTVPEVRLTGLTVQVEDASDPPTTVGEFLPRVLRRARLWVPADGTADTTSAALRLGTGIIHRYGAMPVQVEVRTLEDGSLPDLPYEPLERDFVIGSDGADRDVITVTQSDGGAPLLVLPLENPEAAAAAMFDELAVVALTDTVEVAGRAAAPALPPRERTLLSLGLPTGAVQGTGRVETGVDLPQAAFGGMVKSFHFRVHGITTPSSDGSEVQVSVLFDSELLDVIPGTTDGDFRVDETVSIPPRGRQNRLTIVAEERGDGGPCSAVALPISLQVSGSSSVEAELGTSLSPGFVRFPQAALPSSDVVVADHEPGSVAAVVGLAVALQRLSPVLVGTNLVTVGGKQTVAAAIGDDGPLLLAWDGDAGALQGLGLEVLPTESTTTVLSLGGDPLELDRDVPVLQAVPGTTGEILAATAPDADALRDLVTTAVDEGGGFPALRGDVAALDDSGRLRFAQADSDALPGENGSSSDDGDFPVGLFVAGSLVVVAIGVVIFLLRARRRASRSS
jgi:hypothetical protein